ncbi:hypothetical protein DFJ74DRAFT_394010 [Hyaloraphidium curvatum]|nr:hypothetical protein DFJ74DRAFT_394010 [Hyaloraphidium curvatum]
MVKITDAQLREVADRGFTIVPGFLTDAEVAAARDGLWLTFPRPEDYHADPERPEHKKFMATQFAGNDRGFPYASDSINSIPVHPDLVDAMERLMGTKEIDLYKIELWAKYSGGVDYDQNLHRDYTNHTLVVPRRDGKYRHYTTWILLSDVTETDAPTKIVPTQEYEDLPLWPTTVAPPGTHPLQRFLKYSENKYTPKEIAVTGKAGSLLIYRTDVLHRGSSFKGHPRSRFVIAADFKPRGTPWGGKHAWPDFATNPRWSPWFGKTDMRTRDLFGFPKVDSEYWDEQTVADVGLRYPKMDMGPYRRALEERRMRERGAEARL